MNKASKIFLPEIDLFRGLAIFSIVLGHIYGWIVVNSNSSLLPDAVGNPYKYWLAFEEFLILGGTSFFVYISGFLFYYVFWNRGFNYSQFLISKCKNVFSPYLFFVAILAVWKLQYVTGHTNSNFWIHQVFLYHSFWYIPFIMFVFLCSPLYLKFIELRKPWAIFGALAATILYSTCTARHNTNPVLSMAFWSSFYLLGISSAKYYEYIKQLSKETKWCSFYAFIILATIALAANLQNRFMFFQGTWDYHFVYNFVVLPKMLYCFVILFFCLYLANSAQDSFGLVKKVLHFFAKYSFSIFFIHVFFMYYITLHTQEIAVWLKTLSRMQLQFVAFSSTFAIGVVCALLAVMIHKILGKYSRLFIGA